MSDKEVALNSGSDRYPDPPPDPAALPLMGIVMLAFIILLSFAIGFFVGRL